MLVQFFPLLFMLIYRLLLISLTRACHTPQHRAQAAAQGKLQLYAYESYDDEYPQPQAFEGFPSELGSEDNDGILPIPVARPFPAMEFFNRETDQFFCRERNGNEGISEELVQIFGNCTLDSRSGISDCLATCLNSSCSSLTSDLSYTLTVFKRFLQAIFLSDWYRSGEICRSELLNSETEIGI